ncbi:MAG: Na(+)/H(+) antiporter subunit D [Syntrophales bacterium]|nr:Na(+)/H(+) antiporter subunit D [Syntrophales bacterium]
MISFHPALFFIVGAILLPLVQTKFVRHMLLLGTPLLSFFSLLALEEGALWTADFFSYQLILLKSDPLSLVFAYVFVIASFTSFVYSLHVKNKGEHAAALLYVGGSLGVTFAGDWFTLLVSWELMAVSSVFLIWYRGTRTSLAAGFRYLMVHLLGGSFLLAGIVLHVGEGGNFYLTALPREGLATSLILISFILNAAVPPLHAWLTDAYPEATITGSVFLSAFTTKSAVYILLRVFPGAEILVWLGAIMAFYGVVYAAMENDVRRLLSYHIVSQVGYMVCGVGLGTPLSMNGAAAHAFCHILYKALLFMGVGVVIEATGKSKLTDLQGKNLYPRLPMAFFLYMIGAFSISGVPLFSGFVSKNMIVTAAGEVHRPFVHTLLHLASIGTFLSTTLKLPYGTWFGQAWKNRNEQRNLQIKNLPINMIIAMVLNALLCLIIGIFPTMLYQILPYEAEFLPYTVYSVATTLQLLLFSGLAFWLFMDRLRGTAAINIDIDWIYRRGAIWFYKMCNAVAFARSGLQKAVNSLLDLVTIIGINPLSFPSKWRRKEKKLIRYDPDNYRPPIGVAICSFLALFSLFFFVFVCF